VQRDTVVSGELDRAQHEHAPPVAAISSISSKLTLARRCALGTTRGSALNARRSRRVDLTGVGPRPRRGPPGHVRAPSSEGRDVALGRDALEAGDHRHSAVVERLAEAVARTSKILAGWVGVVMIPPGCGETRPPRRRGRPGPSRAATSRSARRGESMSSSRRRLGGAHLVGQAHQLVGGLAHALHDHDDLVPGATGPAPRGRRRHGCASACRRGPTELLHEERHGGGRYKTHVPGLPRRPGEHAELCPSGTASRCRLRANEKRARQRPPARQERGTAQGREATLADQALGDHRGIAIVVVARVYLITRGSSSKTTTSTTTTTEGGIDHEHHRSLDEPRRRPRRRAVPLPSSRRANRQGGRRRLPGQHLDEGQHATGRAHRP